MICALAAAGIARQRNELNLSARAIDFLDERFKADLHTFNPENIERVLKAEKAEMKFPTWNRGPDYFNLLDRRCDCPACRRARGEGPLPFDDDDEFDGDDEDLFAGMPPEVGEMMMAAMMDGIERNETPEQTFKRLEREFAKGLPFPGKGKRRR